MGAILSQGLRLRSLRGRSRSKDIKDAKDIEAEKILYLRASLMSLMSFVSLIFQRRGQAALPSSFLRAGRPWCSSTKESIGTGSTGQRE